MYAFTEVKKQIKNNSRLEASVSIKTVVMYCALFIS